MANLSILDQGRKEEQSKYGEAVRLSNELRAKPARTVFGPEGERFDFPAVPGFDIETANFITIKTWLNDPLPAKVIQRGSPSLTAFLHRALSIRFPTEYAAMSAEIDARFAREYVLIQSESRNEMEWLGEVGLNGQVRLDGSLKDRDRVRRRL